MTDTEQREPPLTIQRVCEQVTRDSTQKVVGITSFCDCLYVITEYGDLYRVRIQDIRQ